MPDKTYVVLEDQRYTGRHRVYRAGQKFPESELFGNEENIAMALEGSQSKDPKIKLFVVKKKKGQKSTESGSDK